MIIAMLARWGLVLASFVPLAAIAQPAASPPPKACQMLEAAYSAAIGSETPAFPIDIRPAWRTIQPSRFVAPSQAHQALAPHELKDLIANESVDQVEGYRPVCPFTVPPSLRTDKEGHRQFVSFSSPIFSSDRRLALVQISFQEDLGFGYGSLCIARYAKSRWTAACTPSWIT